MKHLHRHIAIIVCGMVLLLAATSCSKGRDIAYLSDAQRDSAMTILSTYSSVIHPGDKLYIFVESGTPESVIPLNQETNQLGSDHTLKITSEEVPGYLVDDQGEILFPLLGKITVAGLTQDSLISLIESRLRNENIVIDPTVSTRLLNFRVTVVGEVAHPQEIQIDGQRLTILEALAICGDLTIYGKRTNITVMRESNGQQEFGTLDLTTKEFLDSPYYYLQQNDIVYVEPNKVRKRIAERDQNIPTYLSIGVSVLALVTSTWRIIYWNARQ
ncbi:MAG: polysaccharide biosynthesis/export family protein [Bacteroidales bacterium]|nr:polysaccharide biosynthesis/export family protein [Bacteroidales bacterium]